MEQEQEKEDLAVLAAIVHLGQKGVLQAAPGGNENMVKGSAASDGG